MSLIFWVLFGVGFAAQVGMYILLHVVYKAFMQADELLVQTRQELERQNTTNRIRSAGLADHNDRLQRLEAVFETTRQDALDKHWHGGDLDASS